MPEPKDHIYAFFSYAVDSSGAKRRSDRRSIEIIDKTFEYLKYYFPDELKREKYFFDRDHQEFSMFNFHSTANESHKFYTQELDNLFYKDDEYELKNNVQFNNLFVPVILTIRNRAGVPHYEHIHHPSEIPAKLEGLIKWLLKK